MDEQEIGDPSARRTLQTLLTAQRTDAPAAGGAANRTSGASIALGTRHHRAEADGRPSISAPDDADHGAPSQASDDVPKARRLWRGPALIVGGVILAALAGAAGTLYLDHAAHFQSTDDAFFAARQFSIAPKVAGYVAAVPVTDNQHVNAGDVIARIDDRDFRVAARPGRGASRRRTGGHRRLRRSDRSAAGPDRRGPGAGRSRRRRRLVFAGQQADRYRELVRTGSGTVSTPSSRRPSSTSSAPQSTPRRRREAGREAGRDAESPARLAPRRASLRLRPSSTRPRLNLSYTDVTAAQAGRIVNLSAAVGQFAQSGSALTMFVPDDVWVTANFKETQLDAMRPGQPVDDHDRRLSGPDPPRPCRQRPARLGHGVLAAAGRERHRQLRQDRPARAGQDHHRQCAGRRRARARHVGRADRADQSRAVALRAAEGALDQCWRRS